MHYKMIAVDLDDSLLGDDLSISSANKDAIYNAVKQGILVTIATGRMYSAALPYVEQLSLDIPVITYQGALIKNAVTQETLFHRPVTIEHTRLIVEDAHKIGAYVQLYLNDEYYIEQVNEKSIQYERLVGKAGIEVGSFEKFVIEEPTKILIMDEPETVMKLKMRYDQMFGEQLQVTISKPHFLEFTHAQATKGKAVEYLAGMFSIDRKDVIAIGDSYNDISMLEYAGLGVAMGNAPDEVKKHADIVTHSNQQDGVAHIINKYALGKKVSL